MSILYDNGDPRPATAPKTPLIAGIVCGVCIGIAWSISFINWLLKRLRRWSRAKRRKQTEEAAAVRRRRRSISTQPGSGYSSADPMSRSRISGTSTGIPFGDTTVRPNGALSIDSGSPIPALPIYHDKALSDSPVTASIPSTSPKRKAHGTGNRGNHEPSVPTIPPASPPRTENFQLSPLSGQSGSQKGIVDSILPPRVSENTAQDDEVRHTQISGASPGV